MAEPRIVFCPSNHIYDAAIYNECPYCKKIQEEQNALSKNIGLDNQQEISDLSSLSGEVMDGDSDTELIVDVEDATELIRAEAEDSTKLLRHDMTDGEEDATELLRRDVTNGEEDATELLRHDVTESENKDAANRTIFEGNEAESNDTQYSMEAFRDSCDNFVLGWLVFRNGQQKGNSIIIRQRPNYIYESNGTVFVSEHSDRKGKLMAVISKQKDDFVIHPCQDMKCGTNGIVGIKDQILRNYDLLSVEQHKFTFVELLTEFVDWGN